MLQKHELNKPKFNNILIEKYALSLMGHTKKTLKYEKINYIVNITFKLVKIRI